MTLCRNYDVTIELLISVNARQWIGMI